MTSKCCLSGESGERHPLRGYLSDCCVKSIMYLHVYHVYTFIVLSMLFSMYLNCTNIRAHQKCNLQMAIVVE